MSRNDDFPLNSMLDFWRVGKSALSFCANIMFDLY